MRNVRGYGSGMGRTKGAHSNTNGAHSNAIRARVGYLAQEPRYYGHMTARDTLRFTARFSFGNDWAGDRDHPSSAASCCA